jgi:hypothetical protein
MRRNFGAAARRAWGHVAVLKSALGWDDIFTPDIILTFYLLQLRERCYNQLSPSSGSAIHFLNADLMLITVILLTLYRLRINNLHLLQVLVQDNCRMYKGPRKKLLCSPHQRYLYILSSLYNNSSRKTQYIQLALWITSKSEDTQNS